MHHHGHLETWFNSHAPPWRKDVLLPGLSRNLFNDQVMLKHVTKERHHCVHVTENRELLESACLVAHAYNASTEEAKVERPQVWSQPGLHCESLSQSITKTWLTPFGSLVTVWFTLICTQCLGTDSKPSYCAPQKDLYTSGASGTQPEVSLTSHCSCHLMTRPILKCHVGSESFMFGQATPSSCLKQSPSFPENPTIVYKGLGKISFHLIKTPAP